MKKAIIICPSSFFKTTQKDKKNIDSFFKKNGYDLKWSDHAGHEEKYLGHMDTAKVQDIHAAFSNKNDLILPLRGGYGTARLLSKLNWKKIKSSTALLVGFSDTTTLQNAYYAKTKKPSITGMLAVYLTQKTDDTLIHSFVNALDGGGIGFNGLPFFAKGKATGILVGGNLTCFTSLLGTPYLPNMKGKILLLEDVGEAPYRIDRMLTQLKNAGVFDKVKGVILGTFYNCRNKDEKEDKEVYNVLKNFFKDFKIPVVYGLPYGHQPQHFCLPFATKTMIDTSKQTLHIDGLRKKR